jgi:hypothetical protein
MKRVLALIAVVLFNISTASAQQTNNRLGPPPAAKSRTAVASPTLSLGDVQATPQMWFYEQQRIRYDEPRNAVRANAEFRAGQRARRMAALKWYGFSNSRPLANPDPVHGTYSPRWVGNGYIPSHWTGGGAATVVIAQEPAKRY